VSFLFVLVLDRAEPLTGLRTDAQLRRSEIFIAPATYRRSAPLGAASTQRAGFGQLRSKLDVAPTELARFLRRQL
jgi:hypothetical protein